MEQSGERQANDSDDVESPGGSLPLCVHMDQARKGFLSPARKNLESALIGAARKSRRGLIVDYIRNVARLNLHCRSDYEMR